MCAQKEREREMLSILWQVLSDPKTRRLYDFPETQNHYEVLGVRPEDSMEVMRKAYEAKIAAVESVLDTLGCVLACLCGGRCGRTWVNLSCSFFLFLFPVHICYSIHICISRYMYVCRLIRTSVRLYTNLFPHMCVSRDTHVHRCTYALLLSSSLTCAICSL